MDEGELLAVGAGGGEGAGLLLMAVGVYVCVGGGRPAAEAGHVSKPMDRWGSHKYVVWTSA